MNDPTEISTAVATPVEPSLAQQRSVWLAQASTVPSLQCGKEQMFPRTLELLRKIRDGEATDINATPLLASGASSWTWQQFSAALRAMGLVENRKGVARLTTEGDALLQDESPARLATLLAGRIRLFAEALGLVVERTLTVQEANAALVGAYSLDWKSPNNTRLRLTWLEALGLVEWLGGRKLTATAAGRDVFQTWETVSPAAIAFESASEALTLPDAPSEIAALLDQLATGATKHEERKTYNIWVPSPSSDPSKIENMRTCIGAAAEPIEKSELLAFIANRFGLKRSSVDSMLPFMRAGGFLQEVRRGVFVATPAAKAWLLSGSDVDFIRILHGNMRFVGELLYAAQENITRSDLYRAGSQYGLNQDKIRWLVSFMVDAGLMIDTSWSSVEATPLGLRLMETLPLAEPPTENRAESASPGAGPGGVARSSSPHDAASAADHLVAALVRSASDPMADGLASGVAFEKYVAAAFKLLGFRAQRISGSGDTDVLVQWYDHEEILRTAIVDAKSTSSGQISHGNVSDVAISTHKEKHAADYVAIVAPSFAGDTIRGMATKKHWALVSAAELGEIVSSAAALGLRPADIGALFETPDGLAAVANLLDARQRELDLISLVVSRLKDEMENDEAFSPRDIALMERRSDLAPSIDELMSTFRLLQQLDADVVRVVDAAPDARHESYRIGDVRAAANRLRALAAAFDRGLVPQSA